MIAMLRILFMRRAGDRPARSAQYGGERRSRQLALANAGIDIKINTDDLIRQNGEMLWPGANMTVSSFLRVKNVSACRELDAIVSLLVRGKVRDFFFAVLAQNNKWIIRIIFGERLCRRFACLLNFFESNYPEVSD